jgi:AraC family transcriptional regulator
MRIPSAGERFGTVLATRRTASFLLRESRYAPRLKLPSHDHEAPYFSFVVRGAIRERDPRRDHLYDSGSLHFHPAGDPHSGAIGPDGMTCLSIVPCREIAARLDAPPAAAASERAALAALATRSHREFHATDAASDLALEALCLELAAARMRSLAGSDPSIPPRWLAAVRDFLRAHFGRRVALAELAAVAGVHPAHLTRTFRRHLGCSPGAYLRQLRIEHARRALVTGDHAIAELALAAGFASQAHFTRVFHRLVGLPPAAYRRRHGRRAS